MKLLYASVMYDYNDKSRGMGLDYYTMYPALQNMEGVTTALFDLSDFGDPELKKKNNEELIKVIEEENPDIMFHIAFTDQLSKETLKHIKEKTRTTTINWFCDDWWRFDSFTKDMCRHFDYSITVDKDSVKKYHNIGYKNVILSQWATYPPRYPKLDLPPGYDVSFVGQPHGNRRETIKKIKDAGISVAAFGYGWKETGWRKRWNRKFKNLPFLQLNKGKISHDEMIAVFNRSRINLNLSASSDENAADQMKARNFEVPSCGGFLLTGRVPHLEDYFDVGKEIVCYDSEEDMIDKIKYYLSNEDERMRIAEAGYRRTLRDHTYEKRFRDVFSKVKTKK